MSATPSIPNAEQIGHWNDAMGKTWAMLHDRLDRQMSPIGREAMRRAEFRAGDAVLDIGCGCGETTLEIAGLVAPGQVIGLDASTMLLDIARQSWPSPCSKLALAIPFDFAASRAMSSSMAEASRPIT